MADKIPGGLISFQEKLCLYTNLGSQRERERERERMRGETRDRRKERG